MMFSSSFVRQKHAHITYTPISRSGLATSCFSGLLSYILHHVCVKILSHRAHSTYCQGHVDKDQESVAIMDLPRAPRLLKMVEA